MAQMLFSPVFGYAHSRLGGIRHIVIVSNIIFIGGWIMYALATLAYESYRFPLLLLSRLIVGIASGQLTNGTIPY